MFSAAEGPEEERAKFTEPTLPEPYSTPLPAPEPLGRVKAAVPTFATMVVEPVASKETRRAFEVLLNPGAKFDPTVEPSASLFIMISEVSEPTPTMSRVVR